MPWHGIVTVFMGIVSFDKNEVLSFLLKRKLAYYVFKLVFLLLSFISLPHHLTGQYYQMQISTVTDEAGNVPSATFAIVEDLQGFIWFGTIDGLYRYDGFNYKIFRNQGGGSNSLSNNTIRGLAVDKNGIIWIATQGGGVDAFDPVSEKFINYRYTGKMSNEIRGNFVWSIIVDSNNDVWLGVSGIGVDKIKQSSGKIEHYNLLENEAGFNQENDVRCLLEDKRGNIWAGVSNQGLSCINIITGKVKNYFADYKNTGKLSNDMPYDLLLTSENVIWTATFGGGINIFNEDSETFTYIRSADKEIPLITDLTYSIIERVPGEYWIAT
ncbi:MAG: hypothetical protein HC831_19925, partial [Chloroflexia bacterium]|nr:hypothetical protein [Chloroflexia bacterium]